MTSSSPARERAATALAIVWAALFAVSHLYWAVGGRLGVPAGAEPISQRPWFLAYDIVAGVLCVVGAALLLALARARERAVPVAPALLNALRLGTAALGARGVVGLIGSVALIAGGEVEAVMVFDLWFLLGAALFALSLGPLLRPPRSSRYQA